MSRRAADNVLKWLRRSGWRVRRLALESGVAQGHIHRVLHGEPCPECGGDGCAKCDAGRIYRRGFGARAALAIARATSRVEGTPPLSARDLMSARAAKALLALVDEANEALGTG